MHAAAGSSPNSRAACSRSSRSASSQKTIGATAAPARGARRSPRGPRRRRTPPARSPRRRTPRAPVRRGSTPASTSRDGTRPAWRRRRRQRVDQPLVRVGAIEHEHLGSGLREGRPQPSAQAAGPAPVAAGAGRGVGGRVLHREPLLANHRRGAGQGEEQRLEALEAAGDRHRARQVSQSGSVGRDEEDAPGAHPRRSYASSSGAATWLPSSARAPRVRSYLRRTRVLPSGPRPRLQRPAWAASGPISRSKKAEPGRPRRPRRTPAGSRGPRPGRRRRGRRGPRCEARAGQRVRAAVLLPADAGVDGAQPIRPPVDCRDDPFGAPGLRRHRGRGVAPVAHGVDEVGPAEQAPQRLGFLHVVGAHLHQPGLPIWYGAAAWSAPAVAQHAAGVAAQHRFHVGGRERVLLQQRAHEGELARVGAVVRRVGEAVEVGADRDVLPRAGPLAQLGHRAPDRVEPRPGMRLVQPVRHEDDADDAAGGGNRLHVAPVDVVLDVVHRPHADVRRDDRDAIVDEVVDLAPGDRRAVRDVGDDAALDHALDDGAARRRKATREVDARVERADRELALVLGDRLRVTREVVREEVGQRDRGHAAVGEVVDAGEPGGHVVLGQAGGQDVAALDGMDDRDLPGRERGVQLGVRAGQLEPLGPRHLPVHVGHLRQQVVPGVVVHQPAPAGEEAREEADDAALEELPLGDVQRGPQHVDPALLEQLEVAQAGQRIERVHRPRPVVAAQVAAPQERVHGGVGVDVDQHGRRSSRYRFRNIGETSGMNRSTS